MSTELKTIMALGHTAAAMSIIADFEIGVSEGKLCVAEWAHSLCSKVWVKNNRNGMIAIKAIEAEIDNLKANLTDAQKEALKTSGNGAFASAIKKVFRALEHDGNLDELTTCAACAKFASKLEKAEKAKKDEEKFLAQATAAAHAAGINKETEPEKFRKFVDDLRSGGFGKTDDSSSPDEPVSAVHDDELHQRISQLEEKLRQVPEEGIETILDMLDAWAVKADNVARAFLQNVSAKKAA